MTLKITDNQYGQLS